jgi:hypothetical protein
MPHKAPSDSAPNLASLVVVIFILAFLQKYVLDSLPIQCVKESYSSALIILQHVIHAPPNM